MQRSITRSKQFLKSLAIAAFWLAVWQAAAMCVRSEILIPTPARVLQTAVFSPILHMIRATPVISFIILALVWIRTDYVPVFISFLMVVPILYAAVQTGLRSVDRELLEMARVFQMKRRKVMESIYLPAILPVVLSQGTVGLGFAWKSGIAAEVICLPLLSIGRQLKNAKATIDTPAVFAWTATIILLSLLLEWLLHRLAHRFERRWQV